ncbi:MAG: hypothetical protein K2X38_03285 [Gemmataceae bacterium]|nr:hypothetical protein [Gemmataceae bacterium]
MATEVDWGDLRLSVARRSFPATERFVSTLRSHHINGGACFRSFRFPGAGPFLEVARKGELAASGFFDHFWQTKAVHAVLPELAAEADFRCKPPFVWGNPFTLDGDFASALFSGGAYSQYKGSAAEAKVEAAAPASELLGKRFERSQVFTNHAEWCRYFSGIVDWTWVVLNFKDHLLHVVAATDVD